MPEAKETGGNWGEDDGEEGELPQLPPRVESEVDVNGVKTITTYRTNEVGKSVKTVQTVKVATKTVRIAKSVLARRSWPKFGLEKDMPAGYHGRGYETDGKGDTTVSLDMNGQVLDMMPKQRAQQENNESAQRAFEKLSLGTSEAWRPKTRGEGLSAAKEWAEANGIAPRDDPPPSMGGGGGGGGSLAALAAGSGKGGYVPPSLRNADGTRNNDALPQRDDSCTVRVSNLSEDVKDADLRELFRRFGPIQRIYLAKDKETHISRGFAFINFYEKEHAARAIEKLDGHGYDHLIMSVSWANPSGEPRPQAPPPPGSFPALGRPGEGGGGSGDARRATEARYDSHIFNPAIDRR